MAGAIKVSVVDYRVRHILCVAGGVSSAGSKSDNLHRAVLFGPSVWENWAGIQRPSSGCTNGPDVESHGFVLLGSSIVVPCRGRNYVWQRLDLCVRY